MFDFFQEYENENETKNNEPRDEPNFKDLESKLDKISEILDLLINEKGEKNNDN